MTDQNQIEIDNVDLIIYNIGKIEKLSNVSISMNHEDGNKVLKLKSK